MSRVSELGITRRIRQSDILHIANRMRATDRAEVWAMSRHGPLGALLHSVVLSSEPYLATLDEEPIALFGMQSPVLGDTGVPWMLGTDRLGEDNRKLITMSRRYLQHELTKHRVLSNYVHDENGPALRYLRCVGFTLSEPEVWHTGAMVREFTMERPDV